MIYFVRHGQTDWNLIKKLQGRVNTLLNKTGIKQAFEAKENLKDIVFDFIFCSPLNRAKQTCEIIVGNKKYTIDDRLIERDFGEYEGFLKTDFDYEGFWDSTKNQKFKKAESIFDIEQRVYDFLESLKNIKNKDILIVAHSGVGLLISSYFNGKPIDGNYLKFLVDTGKILEFKHPD